MSPIKDFRMAYEALNKEGTFSAGDTVTGTVSLTLTKDTKVKSLFVKAKGDANVRWTEGIGEDQETYIAHKRYFKVKECLVTENAKGTVLSEGVHQFSFRLQIPEGNMPSSFKGLHGRIVYMLEAKLSRSWRWPDRLETEIIFASKTLPQPADVMCPQYGSVYKEMGVFSKGQVQMNATVSRKVCSPGDNLSVSAKLDNSSSKKMRPKYSLHQKIVYLANGSANVCDNSLWKMYGDFIPPNSKETVTCQLKIPVNAIYSLQNCDLISVNYYLKVYLDISFASDPEVVFPLVIIPPGSANLHPGMGPGPYPAGAFEGPSYSDFPPPAFPGGPYVPTGSGAYGYPAPDPTQHVNTPSGYNNQWPQQATSYDFSTASFSASAVQHQAPSAPPQF